MSRMEAWDTTWDEAWERGRLSMRARVARLRAKGWHIVQASLAAGVAWFLASDILGHPTPFFAPIAAVVGLGTSYGQRWRRVAEVTFGVAIGVFIADAIVIVIGSGAWQLSLIVMLSMSAAMLLDGGQLLVTQAAVQSIVVASLVPAPGQALLRWTDAVVGGVVALVAATVVPNAPLRRPRDQAALVLDKIGGLLRGAAHGMETGEFDESAEVLKDARSTEVLIRELHDASAEGLSVLRSSPFRVRHRAGVRKMVEIVEPLDLALRNTRVLVRRVAVAAYRGDPLPPAYGRLTADLADVVDQVASELRADRQPEVCAGPLVRLAEATSSVERTEELSAEVILAQLRSIIADLLRIAGMDSLEATDAIPPLHRD